jgi:putative oxidoreductase
VLNSLADWRSSSDCKRVIFTIVATCISHRYWEFSGAARRAQEVNFSKNVCIVGGYLLLLATGGGRFSLDGLLCRIRQGRKATAYD